MMVPDNGEAASRGGERKGGRRTSAIGHDACTGGSDGTTNGHSSFEPRECLGDASSRGRVVNHGVHGGLRRRNRRAGQDQGGAETDHAALRWNQAQVPDRRRAE